MEKTKIGNGIIYQGNTLDVLKQLPDESVDTIITSPPYWGLRDYGKETNIIWDGDPNCEHEWMDSNKKFNKPTHGISSDTMDIMPVTKEAENKDYSAGMFCIKCGAWYGQLGLEPTVNLYIKHLLLITKELKRILKRTGIMFWNHGDNYGGSGGASGKANHLETYPDGSVGGKFGLDSRDIEIFPKSSVSMGYKAKCMVMQNYRLLLKMVDDQKWILRNIIIWNKPNAMPSSVRDRFSGSYEPVFMLVKNKKYWFDLGSVRLPYKNEGENKYRSVIRKNKEYEGKRASQNTIVPSNNVLGRNPGDVWTITTQAFPEAHFATFPEKLIEPMIKVGCPQWICKKCGKARERIVKTEYKGVTQFGGKYTGQRKIQDSLKIKGYTGQTIIGWTDCGCNAGWDSGIVLDPFFGSGTTGFVAEKLNRKWIGIELNPDYIKIAKKRINKMVKGILF